MKVRDATLEYNDFISATRKVGTQHFYLFYFNIVNTYLGNKECDDITKKDIVNMIRCIQNDRPKIQNITINKAIMTLKTVVKYSTDREIKFAKLPEQKKIIETISDATLKTIWEYYKKHISNKFQFRNYVLLRLMLDTGLRMNEIINLKVKDIDLLSSCIWVKITKTSCDRYVCYTAQTKSLLYRYIATMNVNDYLFIDFNTSLPLTTSSVESLLYRLKKRLKIQQNITPHKWRHTFATNFLKRGGDLETLRLLLGHSNLRTTQKYLHLSKNDIITNYMNVMQN